MYKKCNVISSIKVDIRRLILMSFEFKVFYDIGYLCCSLYWNCEKWKCVKY